jgi:hypothetical protein
MFVQLNPDIESYLETSSTLKFAERMSSVELGAARSNRESKDVRDLKEQVLGSLPFFYILYLYCQAIYMHLIYSRLLEVLWFRTLLNRILSILIS